MHEVPAGEEASELLHRSRQAAAACTVQQAQTDEAGGFREAGEASAASRLISTTGAEVLAACGKYGLGQG